MALELTASGQGVEAIEKLQEGQSGFVALTADG